MNILPNGFTGILLGYTEAIPASFFKMERGKGHGWSNWNGRSTKNRKSNGIWAGMGKIMKWMICNDESMILKQIHSWAYLERINWGTLAIPAYKFQKMSNKALQFDLCT